MCLANAYEADLLGRGRPWVSEHLNWYAMEPAGGGPATPSDGVKRGDVREVIKQFTPDEPDERFRRDDVVDTEFGHEPHQFGIAEATLSDLLSPAILIPASLPMIAVEFLNSSTASHRGYFHASPITKVARITGHTR